MNILVTGSSGFIGSNLINFIKNDFTSIVGIDNHNSVVYKKRYKSFRNDFLKEITNFKEFNLDLSNKDSFEKVIIENSINLIIHLAAHPGVRLSKQIPNIYIDNNINNFINVIDIACRHNLKFIYASSSSVYNSEINSIPFKEDSQNFKPDSIYGITKYSNELIADLYFQKNNFKSVGLRFFSVYGEMGRPDMAIMSFIESILNKKNISLNNNGETLRDYTSVKTVIEIIRRISLQFEKIKGHNIYNIGNTKPIKTVEILNFLIKISGKTSPTISNFKVNEQPATFADISKISLEFGPLMEIDIFDELPLIYNWAITNRYI